MPSAILAVLLLSGQNGSDCLVSQRSDEKCLCPIWLKRSHVATESLEAPLQTDSPLFSRALSSFVAFSKSPTRSKHPFFEDSGPQDHTLSMVLGAESLNFGYSAALSYAALSFQCVAVSMNWGFYFVVLIWRIP